MKTETEPSESGSQDDVKQAGTPLRRAGHVGFAILNVAFPLSDVGVIYRRGVKPTVGRFQQAWELLSRKPAKTEADAVGISWSQAVVNTGKSLDQLITYFRRIRAAWWSALAISGCLSILLSVMLLLAYSGLSSSTFRRAVLTLLVLGSLACWSFVKTLIASYRLWQLQKRRVSVAEHGTFKDYLAENRWCRQVLTMGHFH